MEKLLLKPAEVGELTGMGKSKTYELIAAGVIPSVRIGRSGRVPADRLRRWMEELHVNEQTPALAPQQIPSKPAIPVSPSANGAGTAKKRSENRGKSNQS